MSRKSIPSGNMDHRGQVGGGQGVKERTNMSCTHVPCHRLQTYACIAKTHFSPVISCAVFQSHLTLQSNSHITISGIYTQNQTFVLDVVLWHILTLQIRPLCLHLFQNIFQKTRETQTIIGFP